MLTSRPEIGEWQMIIDGLTHTHSTIGPIFNYINCTHDTTRTAVGSRITLTSPDPGAARNDKPQEWDTVHSEKGEVAFIPAELDPARKIRNANGTDQKVRGTVESIRIGDEL